MPGADRTSAKSSWVPEDPFLGTEVQNWGLGGGLLPMDLGRVDEGGGVQSPGTSTHQVSCREAAEWSWAGLGWAVGRRRADSRTQQR